MHWFSAALISRSYGNLQRIMNKKSRIFLISIGWVSSLVITSYVTSVRRVVPQSVENDFSFPIESKSDHRSIDARMVPSQVKEARARGNTGNLTPEEAAQRLKKIMAIPDMWDRMVAAQKVIRDLCKAGYVDEAWDLIDQSPGDLRGAQLRAFFAFSEEHRGQEEMLNRIAGLGVNGFVGDQATALEGLIERMAGKEMLQLFGRPQFQLLFERLRGEPKGELLVRNMLGANLRLRLETGEDPADILDIARDSHQLGLLGDSQLMRVLHSIKDYDAFEKFSIAEKLVNSDEENREWRVALIKQVVSQDPNRSMKLLADDMGDSSDINFSEGLRYWNNVDPSGAVEWFTRSVHELTVEKSIVAAATFSDSAIYNGAKDVALEWAGKIPDEKLKNKQMEKVLSAFSSVRVDEE